MTDITTHEHTFVIPVEWKQKPNSQDGYGDVRYIDRQRPITTIVTKLRCECGEEVER